MKRKIIFPILLIVIILMGIVFFTKSNKIYCYDINDNVICTIYCNGHGYYFVAGEKDDFSDEVLYNYGEYK